MHEIRGALITGDENEANIEQIKKVKKKKKQEQ